MRRLAKVVHWWDKRHDDSGKECKPAHHLWSPCLSLCKLRACSQTKKETHHCGISPTHAGKKVKVRTAIELMKEEAESKSQVLARSCFENRCRGPKKGVGDPALFYCRIIYFCVQALMVQLVDHWFKHGNYVSQASGSILLHVILLNIIFLSPKIHKLDI